MKMNRYIKAMEIGLANEKEGISYLELLEKMEKDLGYAFNRSAEVTFISWFDENFQSDSNINRHMAPYIDGERTYLMDKYSADYDIAPEEMKPYNYFLLYRNRKSFLKGNAAKQYLDYLELTHARKQARQTSYFSIGSIIIAVIAIGIGIYQVNDSPQPPFEVKIIEDNTKVNELQTQVDRLREELHKAEMTIKVQEGVSK